MLRKEFISIVENTVNAGFDRGVSLFLENLEETMGKQAVFEQFGGVDNTINKLLEESFNLAPMTEAESNDDSADDLDDDSIDQVLDMLQKDGYLD